MLDFCQQFANTAGLYALSDCLFAGGRLVCPLTGRVHERLYDNDASMGDDDASASNCHKENDASGDALACGAGGSATEAVSARNDCAPDQDAPMGLGALCLAFCCADGMVWCAGVASTPQRRPPQGEEE